MPLLPPPVVFTVRLPAPAMPASKNTLLLVVLVLLTLMMPPAAPTFSTPLQTFHALAAVVVWLRMPPLSVTLPPARPWLACVPEVRNSPPALTVTAERHALALESVVSWARMPALTVVVPV